MQAYPADCKSALPFPLGCPILPFPLAARRVQLGAPSLGATTVLLGVAVGVGAYEFLVGGVVAGTGVGIVAAR